MTTQTPKRLDLIATPTGGFVIEQTHDFYVVAQHQKYQTIRVQFPLSTLAFDVDASVWRQIT